MDSIKAEAQMIFEGKKSIITSLTWKISIVGYGRWRINL